jgi:SAM-dependent methyltransferase
MNRTDLLNGFIRRRGYQSYLEIAGAGAPWNFEQIDCPSKLAIEAAMENTAVDRSIPWDTFLQDRRESFDLVFIDGFHEEERAASDIQCALRHLNPGGVIVLHDSLPPDEWHQRPHHEYTPGENWNGTVWKAALRQFASGPWEGYVVDCDWGCGVIDCRFPRRTPREPLPERLTYHDHFPMLRRFVRSEAQFLRDLYDVALFYHIAGMGEWLDVVRQHFRLLADVGLDRLTISHAGPPDDLPTIDRLAAEHGLDAQVAIHHDDLKVFEAPAMRLVESWARDSDGSVLYFHTKGVSSPGSEHKRKWRELMNRETIGRWKENVQGLDHFDLVGVNWRDCPPIAHFCGNFWWSRADWVRSLAPFDAYYANPLYPCDWGEGRRLGCEFWVGSSSRRPRVKSLVCSNVDFCTSHAFDCFP